ncbi:hypothetical protein DL98DRAFT_540721 [Cadophora sp. DSE1049]|nr:hypothetical protein DL98DRAFT_540721 [Cadophora sp. DSE1049]
MSSKLFDLLASDHELDSRTPKQVKGKGKSFSARDKNKKKITADKFDRDEMGSQPKMTSKQPTFLSSAVDTDRETDDQEISRGKSSSVRDKKAKKIGADKFMQDEMGTKKKMTSKQKTQAKKAAATVKKKAKKAAAALKEATKKEEEVIEKKKEESRAGDH